MSDGKEVRRYWPRVNDSGAVFMDEDFDGGYVEFTYHDRRMVKNSQLQREAYDAIRERDKQIAELRAEVEDLKSVQEALIETAKKNQEYYEFESSRLSKLVASQEEAIENIRQQVRAMHFDIELASIERAEGEKEHE